MKSKEIKCRWCGKLFEPNKYNKGWHLYCSVKCQKQDYYKKNREKIINRLKATPKLIYNARQHTKKIKKREKCLFCGSQDNLDFHHFYYDNPSRLEHSIVLCKKCHGLVHSQQRELIKDIAIQETKKNERQRVQSEMLEKIDKIQKGLPHPIGRFQMYSILEEIKKELEGSPNVH